MMQNNKIHTNYLQIIFYILAIILSNVMCAATAYNYCDMLWGSQYAGYSAPAWTAFFTAVPFVVGIVICIISARCFKNKHQV